MLAAPHPDSLPGHLAHNVLHFARVLRSAGMPVGTDRVQLALQALLQGGLESRADFHAALQACMLSKAEHRVLFNQAFALFWKDPDLEGRMRALLLPRVQLQEKAALKTQENRRLAAALFPHAPQTESPQPPPEELDVQASLTWNEQEVLRQKDFETMTPEEWDEAKRLLRRGGTRLADCLHQFNRHWARRVLGGKATVLLITDGLAHGDADALSHEAERLAKSCRRLIWLNPLLRYEGFEPKAAGARALLPHVSQLLAAHNLASLGQLSQLLAQGHTSTPL
ncbi:MAG: hypothetical protein C4K60_20995 [Ideonella sp. MAG2]|nr:MAG: hypothetical protein C4K60_20995 [Ideonella sp. MAG2]